MSWGNSTWVKLSLVNGEEVIKLMKAKVHVFSHSVLCVGKMREHPESDQEWETRLSWFKSTKQYRELDGIDGEPVKFEWMIFPGHTTLQIVNQNTSKEGLSSCRCLTTSIGKL